LIRQRAFSFSGCDFSLAMHYRLTDHFSPRDLPAIHAACKKGLLQK
jgi:hypothetical protein